MQRLPLIISAIIAALSAPISDAIAEAGAPRESPRCSRGRANALSEMACELDRSMKSARGALVVTAPIVSDRQLRDGPGLSSRLASVVAGRLGDDTRARAAPLDLSSALGLARDAGKLLYLEPTIEQGRLSVVANLYPARSGFWQRVRDAAPAPVAHGYTSRSLDAEIQSFLPRIPLVLDRIDKAAGPTAPLGLDCADVDMDGSLDLVVVTRHDIQIGRVIDGRFARDARSVWADLAPVDPTPLREPLGAIAIEAGRHVDVGVTDRAYAVRLSPELGQRERLVARIPWPNIGCAETRSFTVAGPVPCNAVAGPPSPFELVEGADALAGAFVTDESGTTRRIRAWRREHDATVVVEDSDRRHIEIAEAGAQVAIGDIDLDGTPEILTSVNTLEPEQDALVVRTWEDAGTLRDRIRLAVPRGIHALAVCPPEIGALRPIAIATTGELWIAR